MEGLFNPKDHASLPCARTWRGGEYHWIVRRAGEEELEICPSNVYILLLPIGISFVIL
jgi:hypothetical protein